MTSDLKVSFCPQPEQTPDVLGWPAEDVDRLLEDRPLSGQSLEKTRPLIEAELTEWIRRTTG